MTVQLPRSPSHRLDGRRALVAGGSRGIGLGASVALAELGAEVVIAARGLEAAAQAAEAIVAQGGRARAAALDVADLTAQDSFFAEQGTFDVVVNSAGLARHGPAIETTPEDFDTVLNVNVRGAFYLARNAAKALQQAGKPGSIIQISSQMGHVGGIDRSVYCATKHAVEGFTKAMAIEWGPRGIRVNTLCPTFIRTPLTEQTFSNPERVAWIESKIKLGRIGVVEDIMGPVQFLASDASALVTGTSILVDGGWTAG